MKTYHHHSTHIWTSRLVAVGLGLSGITCLAANNNAPATADQTPANDNTASQSNGQNWQDQFTNRMQHIQEEMNDLFRDSVGSIDAADKGFFGGPKFDASATVQDRGDNYVASFNLPKRDLAHVKVNIEDGVLSVNASAEQTINSNDTGKSNTPGNTNAAPDNSTPGNSNNTAENNATPGNNNNSGTETEMLNEYEQLVTLPGPVDASKMKVDKKGDSVIVTIPKKDDNKTASNK